MRRFSCLALLIAGSVAALATAPVAFASTVSLFLQPAGSGTPPNGNQPAPYGDYVNPYEFLVGGTNSGGTTSGGLTSGATNTGGSGAMLICDDFFTNINWGDSWVATTEMASNVDSLVKFDPTSFTTTTGSPMTLTFTQQQAYNAAGWLANQMLGYLGTSTAQQNAQINYSYALWELMSGNTSLGPPAGAAAAVTASPTQGTLDSLIETAMNQAKSGYQATNVIVYTPSPTSASQEFLQVVPLPASVWLLISGFGGLGLMARRRT